MKPHIICHMMSPLDGRLIVESWAKEGTALNANMIAEYERLHAELGGNGWIAGTETLKEFATGKPGEPGTPDAATGTPVRPWHLADASARYFAIALDRHARLHWASPTADEGHVVVVLGASVDDAHLRELTGAGVSYLVMPDDDIDLAALLEELHARLGIEQLLLEGGATLNGAFLKAGLIDEVSLLLCPAIDGSSGTPAIFEAGEYGLAVRPSLELVSATPGAHNSCHLRYRLAKP
jgi:riboflavin biosynthesis pyrimidine reductase